MAKRDAAKRGLYSKFYRGPVLGPDSPLPTNEPGPPIPSVTTPKAAIEAEVTHSDPGPKKSSKKRERSEEDDEERRERKRRRAEKKERKERKALKEAHKAADTEVKKAWAKKMKKAAKQSKEVRKEARRAARAEKLLEEVDALQEEDLVQDKRKRRKTEESPTKGKRKAADMDEDS